MPMIRCWGPRNRNVEASMTENPYSDRSRLPFFADALVLCTLCGPSALERLTEILAENQKNGRWWAIQTLRGYQLVGQVP